MVCHSEQPDGDTRVGWFSLPDEQPIDSPAMLKLIGYVEQLGPVAEEDAPAVSLRLQELLRAALPPSGYNSQLADWLLRLETTHPRSRVWGTILEEMRGGLSLHMHGEYGAKLGRFRGDELMRSASADQAAAAQEFLRHRTDGALNDQDMRQSLLDRVHENIAPKGAMCTPCHSDQPTLVDVATLGYSRERVRSLRESLIMRSVLRIEAGEPFYLPLSNESGRP
ncbi:MAG: hypothetical protein D6744_11590 [Planctomycetota bacterium]|nr:MAG: hypothetical protein D6744_11590 [Planctomycetota bacterium]